MLKLIFSTLGLLVPLVFLPLSAMATEKRCGWLHNPTPANWWLIDRQGQWIISTQGGRQAEGIDKIRFYEGAQAQREFVYTNGNYGYGCACLDVKVDRANKQIREIVRGQQVPLSQCRRDPALPKETR